MPTIDLITHIAASQDRCFDLARSVDLHLNSMRATQERVIAGVSSGLLESGQQVTWEGRHFGVWFHFTSRISAYRRPTYFQDSMVAGPFKAFVHNHHFESLDGSTTMRDEVMFRSPLGIIGAFFDCLILAPYLRRLLMQRNGALRRAAEQQSGGAGSAA